MKAMVLSRIVSLDQTASPLELVELPTPSAGPGQIRLRVAACGVCHTELDEIEGRTAPPRFPVVPGHEVIGYVDQLGEGVDQWRLGDRVGVGWIHHSTGRPDENLAREFVATGRDVNGGYAEWMVASAAYAYAVPAEFSDIEAAPLMCAGAIGYRSLRLAQLQDGDPLGLTGFGASAHLVLQIARHLYPRTRVHVFARDPHARQLARQLGAVWAGDTRDRSPEPLRAIVDTTPAWRPIVEALANLAPGGRLVINAIRKQRDDQACLLELNYHEHLWWEKEIKSVANLTGCDIADFLPLAAAAGLHPVTTTYRLEQANEALLELKHGRAYGAKVLLIDQSHRAGAHDLAN
jgi:alcohol dehydrogenase, propanol-preferring